MTEQPRQAKEQTKMAKQETFQVGDHVHLAHVNGGGTGVFGKVLRFLDGGRSVEVQSDFGGLFGPRTFYGPTSRLTKADCQGTNKKLNKEWEEL